MKVWTLEGIGAFMAAFGGLYLTGVLGGPARGPASTAFDIALIVVGLLLVVVGRIRKSKSAAKDLAVRAQTKTPAPSTRGASPKMPRW